jgi:hypothetical protein
MHQTTGGPDSRAGDRRSYLASRRNLQHSAGNRRANVPRFCLLRDDNARHPWMDAAVIRVGTRLSEDEAEGLAFVE